MFELPYFTITRILAGLAWLFVFIIFWWYTSTRDITTIELTKRVIGFLSGDPIGFLLATILGSIPGTISFDLIGAALEEEFSSVGNVIDFNLFVLSVIMLLISIALSRWFRIREMKRILVKKVV